MAHSMIDDSSLFIERQAAADYRDKTIKLHLNLYTVLMVEPQQRQEIHECNQSRRHPQP